MTRCAATPLLALFVAGCTGTIGEPHSGTGPTPGEDAGMPAADGAGNPATMPPAELEGLCTVDAPHPRRLQRLSAKELLATLRAVAPLDDSAIPAGFAPSSIGAKPDENLSVHRDFHESLSALASALAGAIVRDPGGLVACAIGEMGKNDPCTNDFVARLTARLFRGMGGPDDVAKITALTKEVAQRSDGRTALEYAVRATVLSPRTLYLSEGLDLPASSDPAPPSFMSAGEMASWLSYRIVSRPPTEALVGALRNAAELTPGNMRAIIERHFSVEDLQRGGADFLAAWLNVAEIPRLTRDEQKHPRADGAFFASLQLETYGAVAALMKVNDASLHLALTAEQRSMLLGDPISMLVGGLGRPGLFTHPGVLASISNTDHTDIPRRGRFLLKQLFCDVVPSPPANLVNMLPRLPGTPSERERFERLEMEPACSACHVRVNRLGFGLEAYDELGAPRTEDEHANPIRADAVHEVTGYPDFQFTDARDLFTKAARHPAVQSCFARQTFRYFARRLERGAEDACLIRDIAAAGRMSGFQLMETFKETLVRMVLAKRSG